VKRVLGFLGTFLYFLVWFGPLNVWGFFYCRLYMWPKSRIFQRHKQGYIWSHGLFLWASLLYHCARILTGFTLRREGAPPPEGPYLLLCNHQGLIDIPLLFSQFPNHGLRFVVKKQLKWGIPNISPVIRGGQFAFIDRENPGRKNLLEIKGLAERSKVWKTTVVIFPEGTRSRDGEVLPYRPGAIKTYLRYHKVPILPVALDGPRIAPKIHDLPLHFPMMNIRLRIGEPIPVEVWDGRLMEVVEEVRTWTCKTIADWRAQPAEQWEDSKTPEVSLHL